MVCKNDVEIKIQYRYQLAILVVIDSYYSFVASSALVMRECIFYNNILSVLLSSRVGVGIHINYLNTRLIRWYKGRYCNFKSYGKGL